MKTAALPSSSYISIECNVLLIIPSIHLQAKDIILAHLKKKKKEKELVLKLVLDLKAYISRNACMHVISITIQQSHPKCFYSATLHWGSFTAASGLRDEVCWVSLALTVS